ncbi:hypothetical protein BX666DRAFT_1858349, partial [Dichotomocladium elegans]
IMPATCELCGAWLPQHQATCPRNGVHPSQWTYRTDVYTAHEEQCTTCFIDPNDECGTGTSILSSDTELLAARMA